MVTEMGPMLHDGSGCQHRCRQRRRVRIGRLGNGLEWHFGKAAKCGLIKNVNCRYLYTDEVRQGEEDMKDPSK